MRHIKIISVENCKQTYVLQWNVSKLDADRDCDITFVRMCTLIKQIKIRQPSLKFTSLEMLDTHQILLNKTFGKLSQLCA